jgi:hypothetical protein
MTPTATDPEYAQVLGVRLSECRDVGSESAYQQRMNHCSRLLLIDIAVGIRRGTDPASSSL